MSDESRALSSSVMNRSENSMGRMPSDTVLTESGNGCRAARASLTGAAPSRVNPRRPCSPVTVHANPHLRCLPFAYTESPAGHFTEPTLEGA
jgi:hypothetical protein